MKNFIEKNKSSIITIGYLISAVWTAGLLVLDFTGVIPPDTRWEELALAGFIVFIILVYFQMHSMRNQIDGLLSPKLDLVFGDYPSCYQRDEDVHKVSILYRVGLVNLGGKTIEDVCVSVENFEPQGITFGPIKLRFMNQRSIDEKLDIHPGNKPSKFFDVVWIKIWKNTGRPDFYLQYNQGDIPNEIIFGNYRLHLIAEGKDVPACHKTFLITWDGKNPKFSEDKK